MLSPVTQSTVNNLCVRGLSIFLLRRRSFIWRAVFTFNPYLLISNIDLLISINAFLISRIELLISINEFLISRIHLLISIKMAPASIFIEIKIHLLISIIHLLISRIHLLISIIHLWISIKMAPAIMASRFHI